MNLWDSGNAVPIHVSAKYDEQNSVNVLCGDVLTMCRELPPAFFSLIITSPPYNLGKQYEQKTEFDSYLHWQGQVLDVLLPLLKESGSICWQVGNFVKDGEVFPLDTFFYSMLKHRGLRLRNRIIWRFEHGLHASRRFSGRYETLLWFTKGDDYTFHLDSVRVPSKYPGKLHFKGDKKGLPSGNPMGKNPSDVWNLMREEWESGVWNIPNVKANHCEKTEHPCQFPVELAERCVLAMTNQNDWVLDPFAGVGSSLIAAMRHGRQSVGIEQDANYCQIAAERLQMLRDGTLKTRSLGKPIHQPTGRERVVQIPLEWQQNSEEKT